MPFQLFAELALELSVWLKNCKIKKETGVSSRYEARILSAAPLLSYFYTAISHPFFSNHILQAILEESILKIYSDDPNLPYKTTKLKALYIRSEIDGLFAKYLTLNNAKLYAVM